MISHPKGARSRNTCLPVHRFTVHLGMLFAVAMSGCAGLNLSKGTSSPEPPKVRRDRAVHQFEQRRDQVQFEAAVGRWEEGDPEGAAKLLRALLARKPHNLEARLLLVDVLSSLGKLDDAEAEAKQAIAAAPNDPRTKHALGLVREAQGKNQAARALYAAAATADPNNNVFQASYDALETTDQQTEPAQQSVSLKNSLAIHQPRIIHVQPTAIAPEVSDAWTGKLHSDFETAIRQGDETLAQQQLQAMLDRDPSDHRVAVEAVGYAIRCEQPLLAAHLAESALKHFPDEPALARALGLAWYRGGDFRAARQALERAVSLDNSSPLAYFLLGSAQEKAGDPSAAAASFAAARRLDSSLVPAR